MGSYDDDLRDAKQRMTNLLFRIAGKKESPNIDELAAGVDDLNKAWDALTDCLVRQVEARDTEIRSLLNKIAELNKE